MPELRVILYKHKVRLRTARALELQQQVFHQASRIGLEVQPPLSIDLNLQVFVETSEGFVKSGDVLTGGVIRFHVRGSSVLVVKQSAINDICKSIDAALDGGLIGNDDTKLRQLNERIQTNAPKLSRTPLEEPKSGKLKAVKAANNFSPIAIDGLGLIVREPSDADVGWQKSYKAIMSIGNPNE